MKWYFCWSQDSDFRRDHDWKNLIRAAVESARRNTALEPHFIYDGENSAFIEELQGCGVKVIFHRVSFAAALARHNPEPGFQAVARGAFLRFDIPLVADPADDYVLYTDADVIFRRNPDLRGYTPWFFAAAPQFDRGQKADLNSGVMLLNLRSFRALHSRLAAFTVQNLHLGLDQEVLRAFVGQDYLLLPDIYNWKPYWGVDSGAAIIHWYGPKPETAAGWLNGTVTSTHEAWQVLLERDREAYRYYLGIQQEALDSYNTPADMARPDHISQGRPAMPGGHQQDQPWWQVDLGGIATVTEIHILNAVPGQLRDFMVSVSIDGASWVELVEKRDGLMVEAPYKWTGPGTAWARYVRVAPLGADSAHLNQIEVFGRLP